MRQHATFRATTAVQRSRPALCKTATVAEIEAQGWSLDPGRYVGTDVEDMAEKLAAAHLELRELAARAATLEAGVDHVLQQLLEP